MNHFALFDIPVSFKVDGAALTKKYLALQQQYHPDRFAQASAEEQEQALQLSSQINQAYRILKSPDATLAYVLELKGLLEPEEKYVLSPDFLMEMMELNEQLEDGLEDERVATIVHQLQNALYATVEAIITNYQEGITTQEAMLQVKDYYYRKKYLDRILTNAKK